MKMCQAHWDALRVAIDEAGLSSLVPESGEAAARIMAEQLDGQPDTVDRFDPLMGAHWAIVGRLSEVFGAIAVMTMDGCPICSGNNAHDSACTLPESSCRPNYYDAWIGFAVADQVSKWKSLGESGAGE